VRLGKLRTAFASTSVWAYLRWWQSFCQKGVNAVLSQKAVSKASARCPETQGDADLINAAKEPIALTAGASLFSSVDAYAMIRGGHLDLCILGGFQVDERGNLANWMLPGKNRAWDGGVMDLACGAKRVVVAMEHTTPGKKPKILRRLHTASDWTGCRPSHHHGSGRY
jgi:3-oxoacid CoA-transferase B subunit